jgi:predicted permease
MPSATRQIRLAARSLTRTPLVTGAAVVSLALGLGATTAVFSAVNAALLGGLPFEDPDALVAVFRTTPHFRNGPFAPGNFRDLRDHTRTLSALGAISQGTGLLKRSEGTTQISAYEVSGDVFPLLGVRPVLGRLIGPEDERLEAPPVAVLSGEAFRSHFGADPSVVGTTLSVDGEIVTVIGVLPEDFRIPHRTRNMESEIWVPYRPSLEHAQSRRSNYLLLVGRLAGGATVQEAETELVSLMAGIAETYPEIRGESVRLGSMWHESAGPIRGPLLLMLGAVAMVLLIAVANVASLMLARGARRRHEMALRTALGATRGVIVRTVLLESAVLAAAGIAIGLFVAWAGVRVIGQLGATLYPQLQGLTLDARVFGFALGVTALVAVLAGTLPGWQISGSDPQDALRSGSARTGITRSHHRLLRSLVVAELATSAVLLVGAGLLLRAFLGLLDRDPGFETESLLTLVVDVSPDRYQEVGANHAFLQPGMEAVRNLSGVEAAATISLIPYAGWGNNFNTRYEGVSGDETQFPLTESRVVSPGIFATFGQALLRGRLFEASDITLEDTPPNVVVNQALVRRDFPDGDAIGKRFHLSETVLATIVGVVSDIRNFGPIEDPRPEAYFNIMQGSSSRTRFPVVVRVTGDPEARATSIASALRTVDPDAAVTRVRSMDAVISASLRRQRFYMILLGSFALVAVVLAVTGLYGVISYAVAQRTRELGIRAALGSSRSRTLGFVLRDAALLALGGLAVGIVAGMLLTRLLEGMLYGVHPLSAAVWTGALLALFGTTVLAALVPAVRAARVDPLEAIRYE